MTMDWLLEDGAVVADGKVVVLDSPLRLSVSWPLKEVVIHLNKGSRLAATSLKEGKWLIPFPDREWCEYFHQDCAWKVVGAPLPKQEGDWIPVGIQESWAEMEDHDCYGQSCLEWQKVLWVDKSSI
jgi:hypothetical protein